MKGGGNYLSLLPDTETWRRQKIKWSHLSRDGCYVKGQSIRKKEKNGKKKVKTGEKKENNKQAKDQNITHPKEKKKQENKRLV